MRTIEQRKEDVLDQLDRQVESEKAIIAIWAKAPYPEMFHAAAREATARLGHWENTIRTIKEHA